MNRIVKGIPLILLGAITVSVSAEGWEEDGPIYAEETIYTGYYSDGTTYEYGVYNDLVSHQDYYVEEEQPSWMTDTSWYTGDLYGHISATCVVTGNCICNSNTTYPTEDQQVHVENYESTYTEDLPTWATDTSWYTGDLYGHLSATCVVTGNCICNGGTGLSEDQEIAETNNIETQPDYEDEPSWVKDTSWYTGDLYGHISAKCVVTGNCICGMPYSNEYIEATNQIYGESNLWLGYSGNSAYNVQHAAEMTDGQIIAPWSEFNAFATLGAGGQAEGFLAAPGLMADGSTPDMYGSGLCGFCTGVFQAGRNAGLTILEANDHIGGNCSYAAPGDQAMFNYPTSNLRMLNSTGVSLKLSTLWNGIMLHSIFSSL